LTKERIKEHCETFGERHQSPLLIFPEGWVTNGETLVNFANGAFDPGAPVVPSALVYPADNLQITTSPMNWGGDGLFIFRLMFQVYNYSRVSFLPVHNPTNAEGDDSNLYAEHVRAEIGKERERISGIACPLTRHTITDAQFVQHALKTKAIDKSFHVNFELATLKERLGLQYDEVVGLLHMYHDMMMWYRASSDMKEQRFEQDFLGYIQAVTAAAGSDDKFGHVLQEVRSRVGFMAIDKIREAEYITSDISSRKRYDQVHTWEGDDYLDSPMSKFILIFTYGAEGAIRFHLVQKQRNEQDIELSGVMSLKGNEKAHFHVNGIRARHNPQNPITAVPGSPPPRGDPAFLGRLFMKSSWDGTEMKLRAQLGKFTDRSTDGSVWPTEGMLAGVDWPDRGVKPKGGDDMRFIEFKRISR